MKKVIIAILIAFVLVFAVAVGTCNAQTYYIEISQNQYNKIASGNLFYEGQIQLHDNTWHKGWISRFPDTNRLRFRSEEDSIHVYTLTSRDIKSFSYTLNDSFPKFVFKELPVSKRKVETRAIEILVYGDLSLYIYKTVQEIPYANALLQKKYYHQMLATFYIEKNGEWYEMENFEKDLVYLIKDKKDFYKNYKSTRRDRRDGSFKHYINAVIAYNEN